MNDIKRDLHGSVVDYNASSVRIELPLLRLLYEKNGAFPTVFL